jgi:hypothetical protein
MVSLNWKRLEGSGSGLIVEYDWNKGTTKIDVAAEIRNKYEPRVLSLHRHFDLNLTDTSI